MARQLNETLFLEKLGIHIKRVRQSKGISQYKLGMDTMTDASYIRKIERGKQNITILSLFNIATVLEIDLKELLPKEEE